MLAVRAVLVGDKVMKGTQTSWVEFRVFPCITDWHPPYSWIFVVSGYPTGNSPAVTRPGAGHRLGKPAQAPRPGWGGPAGTRGA